MKVSKEIPDESVDLIFTDPPYDKKSLLLYKELALLANRVLKPGGSIVCYCGTYAIPQILDYMKEANLTYYWISAVILQGPFDKAWREHITIKWKPLLYHIKGTKKFDTTQYMSDVIISTKPDKLLHDWQQSTDEPDHIISRQTVPNQTVLDPMMGSGTTGISALDLKRRFIGIELEEETFKLAAARINQFQASKDSDSTN
jgi:DNA modification methylase